MQRLKHRSQGVGIFVIAAVTAITWIAFARHDNAPFDREGRKPEEAPREPPMWKYLKELFWAIVIAAHPLVGVVAFRLSLRRVRACMSIGRWSESVSSSGR